MMNFDSVPLDWHEFDIPKKSGGVRHICAPNDELKALHRELLAFLERQSRLHEELRPTHFAHGFVRYRDTTTAVCLHDWKSPLFLCMDIEDFFDNMPVDYVKGRLALAGLPPTLVDNIIKVCVYKGRFPQGGPCSPMLMNIGMQECDRMIAAYARRHGFRFSRYADDITLSLNPSEAPEGRQDWTFMFYGVDKILQTKLGLHLKQRKSHQIWINSPRAPRRITGVSVSKSGDAVNAPMRMRRSVRAMAHNLWKALHGRAPMDGDWSVWMKIKGYLSYFDHIRSKSLTEAARSADPIVKESEWIYLKEIFDGSDD